MSEVNPPPTAPPAPTKRNIAWFSASIAAISAMASIGSMFVAWRALSAYPDQLATTERLRACVALQEHTARFVGAVSNYEISSEGADDARFARDAEALARLDSDTFTILATIQMLGPPSVLSTAKDLNDKMEILIRAAEDGQRGAELHDEAREVGEAQRRFGQACADAVRSLGH